MSGNKATGRSRRAAAPPGSRPATRKRIAATGTRRGAGTKGNRRRKEKPPRLRVGEKSGGPEDRNHADGRIPLPWGRWVLTGKSRLCHFVRAPSPKWAIGKRGPVSFRSRRLLFRGLLEGRHTGAHAFHSSRRRREPQPSRRPVPVPCSSPCCGWTCVPDGLT